MGKEKGFTLIELLVVVAIVGLLAAIAIPQFYEYKEKAYSAAAHAAMRDGIRDLEWWVSQVDFDDINTVVSRNQHMNGNKNQSGPADDILKTARPSRGTAIWARVWDCDDENYHGAYSVWTSHFKADKMASFKNRCTGIREESEHPKLVDTWWSSP